MPKPFIAVCIASRGVGHYRTIAGVIREVEPYPHRWCWSIGNPIPAAQNQVAAEALSDERVSHLLFIEDDHLLPVGVLDAMLRMQASIVGAPYQLRGDISCVIESPAGVELIGLGCTLVQREVFAAMPEPPFQVDSRQAWTAQGWKDTGIPEHAGGQDIFFCRNARAAGIPIRVLDKTFQVGHLETVRAGARANYGTDEVICWGGSPDMPYYPHKERNMAVEHWRSPSSDLTLDLDPDTPEGAAEINFRRNNGFVRVNASEAKSAEKAQAEADAARAGTPEPKK